MNIIFDFDGTLIDSRLRLFKLFNDLTGQSLLDFDDYWELKRAKRNHKWILKKYFNYDEKRFKEFNKRWLENIETDNYLKFDTIFPYTLLTLDTMKKHGFPLYLVTARQNKKRLLNQLKNLGLSNFFNFLIVENKKEKAELIIKKNIPLSEKDLMVGDTEADVKIAKKIHITSIAVLSGFRNRAILKMHSPDYIFSNINEVLTYVKI
jgi:phosphoglycolate phosphatase